MNLSRNKISRSKKEKLVNNEYKVVETLNVSYINPVEKLSGINPTCALDLAIIDLSKVIDIIVEKYSLHPSKKKSRKI